MISLELNLGKFLVIFSILGELFLSCENSPTEYENNFETLYVTAAVLNIRSGPGTKYNIVGSLSQGQKVYLIEKSINNWYFIETFEIKGGIFRGYVSSKYLSQSKITGTNTKKKTSDRVKVQTEKASTQKFYYGSQYSFNTDNYVKFNYTRSYSGSGAIFITTYKIFHPTKGNHIITIKATHYKSDKKVVVELAEGGNFIFGFINEEKITYANPSLEPFGFRGDIGGIFGSSRVPNQLMVKFVSVKFENIKILEVLGGGEEYGDFIFYVLDKK